MSDTWKPVLSRSVVFRHDRVRGADLLAALTQKYPDLSQATRLKLAVNQTHAQPDVALAAGDEVAVFEPVTGG